MYDFVSLHLKCPVCGFSLMNKDHLLDNKPSIHLLIKTGEQEGTVFLSSIYGSYNYSCNLELTPGEIVGFSCPHCLHEISSKEECLSCGAPMVPFFLEMGGKVSICSRSGCKNHFVEFEDLAYAMHKLHQDYNQVEAGPRKPQEQQVSPMPPSATEKREIIESGTFLQAYCPYCRKSLIDSNLLSLNVKRQGVSGVLYLSPYLNVFTSKSTIVLPEEEVIEDVACCRCNHSLVEPEKRCEACGSPVAKIEIGAKTGLLDFYLCTKKACHWHGLNEEDMLDIQLDSSLDW